MCSSVMCQYNSLSNDMDKYLGIRARFSLYICTRSCRCVYHRAGVAMAVANSDITVDEFTETTGIPVTVHSLFTNASSRGYIG